ncbi:uncharacterized protein A4U43_C05F2390 [Asparagus officinalis]|uniref:Uncharacterized protein n=1 Tax=Asparagus officinalis TaxID=4686 RepID=A0A5P1ENR9_ASPOF|nr:uncharacterized protein LOC109841251 isoform X1 [Asparagus officinalis]XP_020265750.1 uncharacterized protein LOC109841251 isoform X1 [Asparagus officinalis]ONK67658.1 uncharacterized protein A4U43_C05F2390 [Asparagus officinalis]
MLPSSSLRSLRPTTSSPRRIPTLARRIGSGPIILSLPATHSAPTLKLNPSMENSDAVLHRESQSPSPIQMDRNLGFRRDAELGFLSLLFVVSLAMGSFISVALVSLPALNAFRKLAISMDKLKKVVSEEVPGTLSSLKLSSLEINDLTSQLKYLRQRISGSQSGEKIRASKRRSHGGRI